MIGASRLIVIVSRMLWNIGYKEMKIVFSGMYKFIVAFFPLFLSVN